MGRKIVTREEINQAKNLEANEPHPVPYNETRAIKVSDQRKDDPASQLLKYIPAANTGLYLALTAALLRH